MCGIVGYIGDRDATPILINGLKKLEYRGYDSAGIAVYCDEEIKVRKAKGRISRLEESLKDFYINGNLGIGHTRWATHGEPSDINSHPHVNMSGSIAIVHNGIIENYLTLKEWLQEKGYSFVSETDTEVVAHLIDYNYKGDLLKAVLDTVNQLEGSYALGVISKEEPDKLIAVRKDSPLIVGLGNGENFIASDIPAILEHTRNIYVLNDREIAVITKESVEVYDNYGRRVEKEVYTVNWDIESAEKGGYKHFMIKEINEQPRAIRDTLRGRINDKGEVVLDEISLIKEEISKIKKIFITACGTAYHAGVVGKYVIEKMARIPVEVDIASEFRYRNPIVEEDSLTIVISQSGETADTIAALREAKSKGSKVIAITNVVGSSVAREAHSVLYTWAGPEIAVASTKAYITQLVAIYLIGIYLAEKKGLIGEDQVKALTNELKTLPDKVQKVLDNEEVIQKLADENFNVRDTFFIGRGLDYAVSLEGSLKLKEISYIHSEAYAAGELKHGTLALIEKGTLVIALATQKELFDKMMSNIKEVKARGGKVVGITCEGSHEIEKVVDIPIYIPSSLSDFMPVIAVVPLQLLAYYMAVARGCDVDKPRNLAKSVTVE